MSKPKRICLPNITYHLFSRCHNLQNMMKFEIMKDMLIDVLNMTLEKYEFELISYAIMDNHFHFIIRTVDGGDSISRIMQFIKSRYAQRYNKKMNRTGAFWNERFGDTIIEYTDYPVFYFIWLLWYLGFNPVRQNIVRDPREYKYSSINYYLDKDYKPPVKITFHKYFLELGNTFRECVKKFLEYEEIYRKRLCLEFL